MLLFPGQWHRYRPRSESAGTNTGFRSAAGTSTNWFDVASFRPSHPVLHTGVDDAILHPYLAALDRVRTEPIGYQQLISVNVLEILAAALAALRRQRSSGTATRRSCARRRPCWSRTRAKATSIERLAQHFQLSEKHFRRLFKSHTGLSPYQYYLQTRIHRAKEMLLGTTLSIKEIAAALHFENPFHFSKAFKDKAGMSPSQWRGGTSRSA